MSKTKDNLMDFDDSGYDTLKEANRMEKLNSASLKQFSRVMDAAHATIGGSSNAWEKIKESMRPDFMRPEHGWYDNE